jgi:hypothetical protein
MNKKIIKIGLSVGVLAFPLLTFAAGKTLRDIVKIFTDYLGIAVGLIISIAIVTFVFNVYRYFFTDEDKKEAGKYVMYSTIGFFVILSLWGLVAILTNTFKLDNTPPEGLFGAQSSPQQQQAPQAQPGYIPYQDSFGAWHMRKVD